MVLFLCCLLVVLLYGLYRRFLWRYCWLLCFMDCIVDFDGDIVNCFAFWLYHRGGIWFLGYLVSVSVLYGCKFYCIILLYQTLFYLFFPHPSSRKPSRKLAKEFRSPSRAIHAFFQSRFRLMCLAERFVETFVETSWWGASPAWYICAKVCLCRADPSTRNLDMEPEAKIPQFLCMQEW